MWACYSWDWYACEWVQSREPASFSKLLSQDAGLRFADTWYTAAITLGCYSCAMGIGSLAYSLVIFIILRQRVLLAFLSCKFKRHLDKKKLPVWLCLRVTLAVIKHHDQKQHGEGAVFLASINGVFKGGGQR